MNKLAPDWFRHLGAPRDSSDVTWPFSDEKNVHSASLISRKALTIVPGEGANDRGIQSFDKPFLRFLRKLVDNLNAKAPVSVDEQGFPAQGALHADFSALLSPAGYPMTPMSLAPRDNTPFVDSLGLPSDFINARHRKIFDKMWRLIFGNWRITGVKVAKMSTSGAPTWKSSAKQKREHAVFLLANEREVLRLFKARDMVGLAKYAKVVFLMNAGRRDQLDKPGKQRYVFGRLYAESSGRLGEPEVADKRVFLNEGRFDGIGVGEEYADFQATRARLFHGAPFAANLLPQIIATGTIHAMFETFPETWHCTNVVEAIEAIPTDEDLRCSDATEYDRSMRTFLIKRMFAIAREYWSEEVIDWAQHLAFCAYYSRPTSLQKSADERLRGLLMGEPFAAEEQVHRGNPSGHAWTSLIAKGMMVFDFLATADDLMGDVFEDMALYLNHKKSLKTKNNGDDGMYHGPNAILNKYVDYRFAKDKNPGYFVLEPEVGNVWSGYTISRREGGGFTAYSRPVQSLSKITNPERSAGSNFRPKFSIGIIQRINGGDHPFHGEMIDIFFKTWADEAASTYGDFMDRVMSHHARLDPNLLVGLTEIDREVMEKPQLLYYKYKESDVSPSVISMLFEQALTPQEILPFVGNHYNGNVIGEIHEHREIALA